VIPLVFGSDHGEALHESATRFLVIEQVPIDDLAADPANPRHTQTRRWRPWPGASRSSACSTPWS